MNTSETERSWGAVLHLSALGIFLIPVIGGIVVPLVIWLLRKDDMPFIDNQGKEVVNFNITALIFFLISAALIPLIIGIFMIVAVGICWLLFTLIGASKAYKGERYRYPFAFRLF